MVEEIAVTASFWGHLSAQGNNLKESIELINRFQPRRQGKGTREHRPPEVRIPLLATGWRQNFCLNE